MHYHRCQYERTEKRKMRDFFFFQIVILHYEIHSFIMIDVPGSNDNNYVADFAERISFAEHWKLVAEHWKLVAEHWKLVAESSEFHLTLSRAHFFQLDIRTQKSRTF